MVAPPLPQGRQLAQLVRQLWKEQEAALVSALRTQGAAAFIGFNPQAWFNVFLERIKPIYARYLVDGRAVMDAKLRRKKSLWHIFDVPQVYESPEVDDEFSIYNPEAVNFINQYSYAFAQSTLDTTKMKLGNAYNRLKQELAQGIEEGQSIRTTTAEVMRIFRDPARAMTIATSEVSRAYHAGQEIAAKQSGVVSGKKWLASADACPRCLELDGKTVKLGEPFTTVPGGGPYASVQYPPLHPRCVLGETPVRMSSLISVMKSKYNGPIVRLHFSDGSSVGVTPNHMLLSSFGFLRASDFMQGDDVICAGGSELNLLPSSGSPNDNNRPPLAHEVFHAFRETGGVFASSVPVSPEYLHGDAAFVDGNIDVIRANRFLGYSDKSTFSQPFEHLPLVLADMFRSVGFSAGCNLTSHLKRLLLATNGGVGRSRELFALLRGVSRIAEKLSLGACSNVQSKLLESAHNARTADIDGISDVQNAFPAGVTTLKVVKVESILIHEASVYDFETDETMYIVGNGIVSSNCMCSFTEVLSDEWNPGETVEDWYSLGR